MAKEDTAPGLLSKMVKFVRNPATNWSDLDSVQTDRNDSTNKQLLKEMIERKRRNDFVRKREFDMLRKMRKREATVSGNQDTSDSPSFFQSSLLSRPDDRASTLKKIDEIEAQMSMQWWKSKDHNPSLHSTHAPMMPAAATPAPLLENALPLAYRPTAPAGLPPATPPTVSKKSAVPRPATAPDQTSSTNRPADVHDSSASGFSFSKASALDVDEGMTHHAELEETAIRFANGDDAGAEASLLEILQPGHAGAGHVDAWLTLFDLYRATAQPDKFETAAIQFVARFDRSAPQWFSMPDMVQASGEPAGTRPSSSTANWVCPSVLGIQSVAALKAALARSPMPWCLDWSNLKTIEATAVEPMTQLFSGWAAQPVQLRFMGNAQLQKVLENATPSGLRESAQINWKLRMEALRVTHQPNDFELVALDFCVTYELSPPAWERAHCDYQSIDAQGDLMDGPTVMNDIDRDSMMSSITSIEGDTQFDAQNSSLNSCLRMDLSGQIRGDANAVLDKLEAKLAGANILLISCAALIRVDFSAAGSLLNWVSARTAENRSVQFSEVNRLVAAFFNVIGITEHAGVIVRND